MRVITTILTFLAFLGGIWFDRWYLASLRQKNETTQASMQKTPGREGFPPGLGEIVPPRTSKDSIISPQSSQEGTADTPGRQPGPRHKTFTFPAKMNPIGSPAHAYPEASLEELEQMYPPHELALDELTPAELRAELRRNFANTEVAPEQIDELVENLIKVIQLQKGQGEKPYPEILPQDTSR